MESVSRVGTEKRYSKAHEVKVVANIREVLRIGELEWNRVAEAVNKSFYTLFWEEVIEHGGEDVFGFWIARVQREPFVKFPLSECDEGRLKSENVHRGEFIAGVNCVSNILSADVVLLDNLGKTRALDADDGTIDFARLRKNVSKRVARHTRGVIVTNVGADLRKSAIAVESVAIENNERLIKERGGGEQGCDSPHGLDAIFGGCLESVADRKAEEIVGNDGMNSFVSGIGDDYDDGGDAIFEELADTELKEGFSIATDLLKAFDTEAETTAEASGEIKTVEVGGVCGAIGHSTVCHNGRGCGVRAVENTRGTPVENPRIQGKEACRNVKGMAGVDEMT